MAAFTDLPSEGTLLAYAPAPGGSMTTFAQITGVQLPGGEVVPVENWHQASGKKTRRPGRIPDPGQITFAIYYNPNHGSHVWIQNEVKTPPTSDRGFQITFNDGYTTPGKCTFPGFVTKFDPSQADGESSHNATITIQLNDFPAYTPGA